MNASESEPVGVWEKLRQLKHLRDVPWHMVISTAFMMMFFGAARRVNHAVRSLARSERYAWALALALFGAGDMALTAVGLHLGAVESNPVALSLVNHLGLWPAMIGVKSLILAWVWLCWRLSSKRERVVFPAIAAAVGVVVVVVNSYVVAVHAGVL